MLPALRSAFKDLLRGFGSTPEPLDLKSYGAGVGFDAINVGWYARNGYNEIYSILAGGQPAWSGESVNVNSALNHSVVFACRRLIGESVAFLPLPLMQQVGDEKRYAVKHPMYQALQRAPSEEMTAMGFRDTLTGHCLLQGNAYAQITRRSGDGAALQLHPLLPSQVLPDREKDGQKRLVYVVEEKGERDKTYTVKRGKPHDLLHIRGLGWDGLKGYSVISMGTQSIGTGIATERHVGRFYASGGRLPYVLKLKNRFANQEVFNQFRANWERTYSEPHKAPILENDTEYEQIGLNARDAQMLETRLFNINEICRWFSVSPHMVGDLSRATFSNIEQLALDFVKFTLSAWIVRWEQELWRCVLTDEEKGKGYYFKHNLNALLRGDFPSRMAGYATALQNGIQSQNEVRGLEDMDPFDGGDNFHIQLNMQTLPGGQPLDSQTPSLVRIGSSQRSTQ